MISKRPGYVNYADPNQAPPMPYVNRHQTGLGWLKYLDLFGQAMKYSGGGILGNLGLTPDAGEIVDDFHGGADKLFTAANKYMGAALKWGQPVMKYLNPVEQMGETIDKKSYDNFTNYLSSKPADITGLVVASVFTGGAAGVIAAGAQAAEAKAKGQLTDRQLINLGVSAVGYGAGAAASGLQGATDTAATAATSTTDTLSTAGNILSKAYSAFDTVSPYAKMLVSGVKEANAQAAEDQAIDNAPADRLANLALKIRQPKYFTQNPQRSVIKFNDFRKI